MKSKIIKLIMGFLSKYLPELWGVVYAKPNPDGSRKKCANCFMWSKDKRCLIHNKDLEVVAHAICGYHVFGEPAEKWKDKGINPVEPKYSGLEVVHTGTSCDLCTWYSDGYCLGVWDEEDGQPAPVAPKGCCARWEAK